MNDSILQLEVENLRELLRLKNLNKELLDANHNLLSRIVSECERYRLPLEPELMGLLARVKQILNEIADQPIFDKEKNNHELDSSL